MSHHNNEGEHQNEQDQSAILEEKRRLAPESALSRPQQILRDAADEESISDEEAVLAYNANADRQAEAENSGTAREE